MVFYRYPIQHPGFEGRKFDEQIEKEIAKLAPDYIYLEILKALDGTP